MVNLEGEETFDASYLGTADEVVQERICDDELILIKGLVSNVDNCCCCDGIVLYKLSAFFYLVFLLPFLNLHQSKI